MTYSINQVALVVGNYIVCGNLPELDNLIMYQHLIQPLKVSVETLI